MQKRLLLSILGCIALPALAQVTAEQAARMTADLTPMGAIRAANEAGTIPQWEGGITTIPDNYDKDEHHADPFPDDEPQFKITAQNYKDYKGNLTVGQQALFKAYPNSFYMPVYQTRRSASFPEHIYKKNQENAANVTLVNGGNGIDGTTAGTPFPMPQHGQETMWNHILRYAGFKGVDQYSNSAVVQANGDYTLSKTRIQLMLYYNNPEDYPTMKDLDNQYARVLLRTLSPPKDAGEGYLLHVPLDRIKEPARVWVYNPGTKRTKKFQSVGYDATFNDGLMTHDQATQFNGPMDRYTFELTGKKEIYIPYNSYKLHSGDVEYDEIVNEAHPNPELTRYELHRVWVVEATVKEGFSHIYQKRVFYFDEDSWNIVAQDIYDEQGQFWRYGESHLVNLYHVPTVLPTTQVYYDLQSLRYVIVGMTNEEKPADFDFFKKPSFFQPNRMSRILGR